MATVHQPDRTSQAAIFARLWESADGGIPVPMARHILKLTFSEADERRMHELAQKNEAGQIAAEEVEELDNFVTAGDLLALLQSKARQTLRKKAATKKHG